MSKDQKSSDGRLRRRWLLAIARIAGERGDPETPWSVHIWGQASTNLCSANATPRRSQFGGSDRFRIRSDVGWSACGPIGRRLEVLGDLEEQLVSIPTTDQLDPDREAVIRLVQGQ